MNEYQKQATDFCEKYGVTMTAKFNRLAPYFDGDKDSRLIYDITLERNGKSYSFTFGQSISKFDEMKKQIGKYSPGANYHKPDLTVVKRLADKPQFAPTAYDVLACLQKYEPGADAQDFANEFGYEINSIDDARRVEKLFRDVCAEYFAVMRLFADCIDELAEIC